MHELTLLADIMRKIDRVADDERATEVIAVHLQLGALAHISPEHLREHFEQAAHGTRAQGARLDITEIPDIEDEHAQDILLTAVEVSG